MDAADAEMGAAPCPRPACSVVSTAVVAVAVVAAVASSVRVLLAMCPSLKFPPMTQWEDVASKIEGESIRRVRAA